MRRSELPPRYVDVSPVGAGSFATVFAAEDELVGRRVAVKILKAELAHDLSIRRRFAREVRAAALLGDHPNVVTVHDAGEWEDRPYLVMELLEGSVADRLRAGPVPEPLALRWLAQAAEALDFVHARGVVHRDVKPANLLLDAQGDLRLADFGIASVDTGGGALTLPGQVVGTPAYLAPELAGGQPATPASDRYSFALVARELLPGEPAIARGLAHDPGARYASAAELVAALGDGERTLVLRLPAAATEASDATKVAPAPPPPVRHRVVRFRRAAWVLVAVAAASAALGAYVSPRIQRAIHDAAGASTPPTETCAVSTFHHDANILVHGVSARAFCAAQPHVFELAGDTWSYHRGAALYRPDRGAGALALVCRLRRGSLRVTVYDAGHQAIGHQVCGWYAAGGWSPSTVA